MIRNSKERTAMQCIIFIVIFAVLLVLVSYMVRTNGDVKDRFSGFYAEKNDTLDIVIIGSSPVFPYYSAPKLWGETGIAMYPLSSNVQRPIAMKYLVREAEKSQSPELYIFEMRMFTMEDAGLSENMAYTRGVTDNMKYSPLRYETIRAMVHRATFYNHFNDKTDLVNYIFDGMQEEIYKRIVKVCDEMTSKELYLYVIDTIIEYCLENRERLRLTLKNSTQEFGSILVENIKHGIAYLVAKKKDVVMPSENLSAIESFFTGGVSTMCLDIVVSDKKIDKEKLVDYIGKLLDVSLSNQN